jgi:hypothetical protein
MSGNEDYESRLKGYVDVNERILKFYDKHPDGRLTPANPDQPYEVVNIGGDLLVVYTAAAYRDPDDPHPGIGVATERYPGLTPYTRGSEIMNAETSAWGRAIVATGITSKDGAVASRQEVENRRNEPDDVLPAIRCKAGLLDLVSGDKALAASIWADADLEGAEHITRAKYDELLATAREQCDPFPTDGGPDDDPDDAPPPPAEPLPPTLPPDSSAAVEELKAEGPPLTVEERAAARARTVEDAGDPLDVEAVVATVSVSKETTADALADALAQTPPNYADIAVELLNVLALDATPTWAIDNVIAAIELLLARLGELKLREYGSTGLFAAASGGATLPTTKVAAADVIRAWLGTELERCHQLADVAKEFS